MAGIGGMAALVGNAVRQKRKREQQERDQQEREQKAIGSLIHHGSSALIVG